MTTYTDISHLTESEFINVVENMTSTEQSNLLVDLKTEASNLEAEMDGSDSRYGSTLYAVYNDIELVNNVIQNK